MSFRDRNKNKRKDLEKQQKNQEARKDQKRRISSYIDEKKLPEGVEKYLVKEGDHHIDIIPWEAGKNHPHAGKGEIVYVLDLHVHFNVGKYREQMVCPWENFGEPCRLCQKIKEGYLPKKYWQELVPKRRVIYLVWSHKNRDEEKKGIQIMEAAYSSIENELIKQARLPDGGGHINFSDWEKSGKSVFFTREGTGLTDTNYGGFKLLDRKKGIPDKILDQSFSIDDIIEMKVSYKKTEKIYKQMNIPDEFTDEDFEEKNEKESSGKKSKRNKDKKKDKKSKKQENLSKNDKKKDSSDKKKDKKKDSSDKKKDKKKDEQKKSDKKKKDKSNGKSEKSKKSDKKKKNKGDTGDDVPF